MKPIATNWKLVKPNEIMWNQAQTSDTNWDQLKSSAHEKKVTSLESKNKQVDRGETIKHNKLGWNQAKPNETEWDQAKSNDLQCKARVNYIKWDQCRKMASYF